MMLKANYIVDEDLLLMGNVGKSLYSSNGTVAKELGVGIPSGELVKEDRIKRILTFTENKDIKPNKIYPADIDTTKHMLDMMSRSHARGIPGSILDNPQYAEEECMLFVKYCIENKIAASVTGLTVWLGISREHFLRLRKSDKPIGLVFEKAADYVAAMRVSQTDHGGINPVWNMFMLANDHKFTRSDEKNAFNIQINNQGYSNDEISNILQESDVFDDI